MEHPYDLIIIGAGPAGISAAIYAGRAKLQTLVIDSGESGGQIRITNEVVNYPGILNISGAELSDTMRRQALSFGAEIRHARITALDIGEAIKKITTDKGIFSAYGVIVATGARPRKAGFEGEEAFKGRGIGYCATCDGEFFTDKEVLVIGGGFAAAEEALFLTRYAKKVTVLVREEAFTCSKTIGDKVLSHPQINVLFQHELLKVSGEKTVTQALIRNNATQETWTYQAGSGENFGVFVFAGYEPMNEFMQGVLALDSQGYLLTNEDLETDVPGVYGAGDIRPKKLRQLVTAVADGALAATNAEKYVMELKESLGVAEAPPKKTAAKEDLVDDRIKEQLALIFAKFQKDLYVAVRPGLNEEMAREQRDFLDGLAGLSDKIHIENWKEMDLSMPLSEESAAIVLLDKDKNMLPVAYSAVPGGHEFNSFILALYNGAGPGQPVDEAVLNKIKSIKERVHLQIGVTLSCTMCPDVVQNSQLIAFHNPNVTVEIVDISKNSAFRDRHQILSVPVIIHGDKVLFGRKNIDEILDHLLNNE